MARSIFFVFSSSRRRVRESSTRLFLVQTTLAIATSLLILLYISSTSKLLIRLHHTHLHLNRPLEFSTISPPLPKNIRNSGEILPLVLPEQPGVPGDDDDDASESPANENSSGHEASDENRRSQQKMRSSHGHGDSGNKIDDVFHDGDIFRENYRQMNSSLKIYVYPHPRNHPFANVLLPDNSEPGGNYASESYFKKVLMKSHFVTDDPSEAHLFYLPFSIAGMRNDRRIGVGGIKDFVRDYVDDIRQGYPYWNRTGGADHFYVACHSVGRSAMEKAAEVKLNAIQVVCSSSYFLAGYVAHKDASIPQIWPRKGDPPTRSPSKRKNLAFFAGAMNSRVRQQILQTWKNDREIFVHQGRLKTPYSDALLDSKFCLQAKGFEVNTARIGDSIYYGCVPVILADHYDLPFADILNWNTFSVVVSTFDIPFLKKILQEKDSDEYLRLQRNVIRIQTHFRWHHFPVDYDAFYMVMYELWLRRSRVRLST